MIFEKASTRTRLSFEAGIQQLGGAAIYLNTRDSQLGRGEPVEDAAQVISRMSDVVMIRNQVAAQQAQLTQIKAMVAGLAERLKSTPDDLAGWLQLGVGLNLGQDVWRGVDQQPVGAVDGDGDGRLGSGLGVDGATAQAVAVGAVAVPLRKAAASGRT